MKVKILRVHKNKSYWYKSLIGRYVEVNDIIEKSRTQDEDLFVIYLTDEEEYGAKKYIYISDTNYYNEIRKEKLKKLNNV